MFGLLFILLLIALGVFASVFWIWMLIDCALHDPDQDVTKIVWILIILFTHGIGALIYYFVRRPKRFNEAIAARWNRPAL